MHDDAVRHFAGHLRHQRPHRGEEHPRRAMLGVVWREERRHQRVLVELAGELQGFALVPIRPDGPHGEDELPHPRRRVRPRHAEPLGDVRADLRAEAKDEAPFGRGVQIVADVGKHHRGAGEGDGDAGHQIDALGALRRERQGQERIVRGLGGEDAAVAHLLQFAGLLAHFGKLPTHVAIDLHRLPPCASCASAMTARFVILPTGCRRRPAAPLRRTQVPARPPRSWRGRPPPPIPRHRGG